MDTFETIDEEEGTRETAEKKCPVCESTITRFARYDINEKGKRVISYVAMCACGKEAVSFVSDLDAMQKWEKEKNSKH